MSRLPLVNPETASGRSKELLETVKKKMGAVPNITRALANSPAALRGYLEFSGALAEASLSARVREQIALAVAEVNGCGYCLSAHSFIGAKLGLDATTIEDSRRSTASDPKTRAVLGLARELVLRRGELRDADLRTARDAGITDGEIAEIVGVVALNLFTNYFNHVAKTPIDFPEVKPGLGAPQTDEACAPGSRCHG